MNRTVPDPPPAGRDHVAPTDDPENTAARDAAWKAYTVDRDAVYQGRLDLEERYKWATAFGPDKDLAIAQAAFRKQDPDGAKWVDSDPPTLHDIIASYHRDLRQEFDAAWKRTDGHPDADTLWPTELARLREALPERFAHFADRQRRLDEFDGAFTRALDQFRKDNPFGSTHPSDVPDAAPVIKYDEATGTHLARRAEGPADQVRSAGRARVAGTADTAWKNAGNRRPQGEHARAWDNTIREVYDDIPLRLAHRSDQERQASHAERAFDRAYSDWLNVRVGVLLRDEARDRARREFLRDLRRHHDDLDLRMKNRPREEFDCAWRQADQGLRDSLAERLEHSRFRDRALVRGRRVLDEALARHEARSPLGMVHEGSEERLACAWLKDIEKAVDDHWITTRDRLGRHPGRDGTRDPGDPPDTFFASWDERFKDLAGTIPHRISHELEKSMVLRRATVDFHRLAGRPADLCGRRYDVSAKQFDEMAKDFCGDTIAAYEWIWAPSELHSQAWLAARRRFPSSSP